MTPYTITIALMWAVAAAGLAWYCASIARQITYITLADGRQKERALPLMFKLLLPLTPNLTPVFEKRVFDKTRQTVSSQIVSAGFEGLITASELMALRIILPISLGIPWILFIYSAVSSNPESFLGKLSGILYIAGPILLSISPSAWLKKSMQVRQKSIQRSLPFILDLLTLSVEAGMDFMTALQRGVERRNIDPLAEELIRLLREIQLGKTRREALRAMSERINIQDIRSVVSALVQADELGVGIGSIMRIQSDQIRQRRFERAERLANEAPVKMLGPLLFFIFPAVFIILMGPVLYRTLQQGF